MRRWGVRQTSPRSTLFRCWISSSCGCVIPPFLSLFKMQTSVHLGKSSRALPHSLLRCINSSLACHWDGPSVDTGLIFCNRRQPWPCNCFALPMRSERSGKSVVRVNAPEKAVFQSRVNWWAGQFICPESWVLIYLPLLNLLNTSEWFFSDRFNSAA